MALSETLIMAAANAAPHSVERLIRSLASNETLLGWTDASARRILRHVKQTNRVAVVSDTNIGDALILQGACRALKRWLPACEIDYIYQSKAHPLLRANPFISRHCAVFTDPNFTSVDNRRAVQQVLRERRWDLIINLYPFLTNGELAGAGCPVLVPSRMVAEIVRAEQDPLATAHVAFQLQRYVDGLARALAGQSGTESTEEPVFENILYLDAEVPERADSVLRAAGVEHDDRIAFLNPDSSSRFSRIPTPLQVDLVRGLLRTGHYDRVLLGPAYSFADLPDAVYAELGGQAGIQKLVRLPPGIPIDTYAGIVDRADLFITADTAQMHIAAARRVASSFDCPGRDGADSLSAGFRNRTALVSVFGATNSRIYGYDSFLPGYLDSSQNAPARVFEGSPACKNLTCIHKTRKTCRTVECFNGLGSARVLEWIQELNWPSTAVRLHQRTG